MAIRQGKKAIMCSGDSYRIPDLKRDKCSVHGDLLGQERCLQGGEVIFALGEKKKIMAIIIMILLVYKLCLDSNRILDPGERQIWI